MVVDNKGTITYVQLLKEDLVIIRFVPNEGPVPDYKAGQFTIHLSLIILIQSSSW